MDQLELLPSQIKALQEELSQVKDELRRKELLFENIVESSLAGYWLWDIEKDTFFLSPSLKKMFGYEDHELLNSSETIDKLMFDQDLPRAYEAVEKHVESNGKIPFKVEVRYTHKNGSTVWVICTGNIVDRDEDGKPMSMLGCHLNITDLKKAEDLQKYAEELELRNMEMEQFAYVASHDLQEPLNTIKSFSSLLKDKLKDKPDKEVEEYLSFISQGTDRMKGLIKGLLEYSRIGKESVLADVDCSQVLNEIVKDHSALISELGAKVECGKMPTITGYPTELRIVFQNLIGNALKYNKDQVPTIRINAEKHSNYWKFSVEDNGIGIAPKDRVKIFKLYQRLHVKSEYDGSGLGLAHCHKIVEDLHHGRIWVEESKSGGSIFYFTIPMK